MWDEIAAPRRRRPKADWMISLTDLMSLILAFFVLLFSTKSLSVQKWQEISSSMRSSFEAASAEMLPQALDETKNVALATSDGLQYLQALFARRLGADAVWGTVAQGAPTTQLAGAPGLPARLGYPLPPAVLADTAAIARLAGVVRNWDNALILTLRLKADQAESAVLLAQWAHAYGVLQASGVPMTRAEVATATAERPAGLWLEIVAKQ